jgi:hypothetical protein
MVWIGGPQRDPQDHLGVAVIIVFMIAGFR